MNGTTAPRAGAVMIHRWFRTGEGWAYHPTFEPIKYEILAALTQELDMRKELEATDGRREFARVAFGGVLLGEQVDDPDCPDEKATGRYPTILRAVFLTSSPSPEQRPVIMKQLSLLLADRPGSDDTLALPLEANPQETGGKTRWRRRFAFRWRNLWVAIVIVAVFGGAPFTWYFWQPRPPQSVKDDEQTVRAVATMRDWLIKWKDNGIEKIDKDDPQRANKITDRFFTVLSQEQISAVPLDDKHQHPDFYFIRRFPERGARPRDAKELRRALQELHAKLAGGAPERADGKPSAETSQDLSALVEKVAEAANYVTWWEREGFGKRYALDDEEDPKLVERVRPFILDAPTKEEQDIAIAMLKPLNSWKIKSVGKEDAEYRPWLVIHRFFQVLSQEYFTDKKDVEKDLEIDAWYVKFFRRLPPRSLGSTGRFLSGPELEKRVMELANLLRATKSPVATTRIEKIAEAMRYEDWKQRKKEEWEKAGDPQPLREEGNSESLNRFVERFRRSNFKPRD